MSLTSQDGDDLLLLGAFDSYGGFGPRMGLSRQDVLARAMKLILIDMEMYITYKSLFDRYPMMGNHVYEPVKRIENKK
jgi:hypothetical protein